MAEAREYRQHLAMRQLKSYEVHCLVVVMAAATDGLVAVVVVQHRPSNTDRHPCS